MEISIKGGTYQLPRDFELEIEEVNPLLTEKGSRSIPVTLPGSPHNLALLDNPHRIALKGRYATERTAVIQDGVFRQTGKQIVFSASTSGINTTFYFKEGDFYATAKDINIADIFKEVEPIEDTIDNIITYLDSVMKETVTENRFAVFPVVTQWEGSQKPQEENAYFTPDMFGGRTLLLNRVEKDKLVAQAEYEGIETKVPGYGITVFPYLSWVLDEIFKYFGFVLKPTLWHTDKDLKKLVLLNSTADVLAKSVGTAPEPIIHKLNFADVVPTSKVNVFLDCICKKFNCAFDIDSEKKTAEFYFLDKILANKSNLKDITPFAVGDMELHFTEAKRLIFTSGKSSEFVTTETKTFEEFVRKHGDIDEVDEAGFKEALDKEKLIFRKATGTYHIKAGNGPVGKRVSSVYFDYDEGDSVSGEAISPGDEYVPLALFMIFQGKDRRFVFVPFVGQRRHVYTVVSENGEEKSEQIGDQKIMFCFASGKGVYEQGDIWYHGTPFCYNHKGEKVRDIGLQYGKNDGIFEQFYKNTAQAKRDAFVPVKGVFRFPLKDFMALRFNKLYVLHGQPVIIKSNKYAVRNGYIDFKNMELIKV